MAQRFLFGAWAVALGLGFVHASFVGCGSSDDTRIPRDDAGGGGGEPSAAGSSAGPIGGELAAGEGGAGGAPQPRGLAGQGGIEASGAGGSSGAGDGGEGASSGEGGTGGEPAAACISEGSRIKIAFDALNAERVTNLQWIDSDGVTSPSIAAQGGSGTCGDPTEFFGPSYGVPEGTTPYVIVAGSRSTGVACGLDFLITSAPTNCNQVAQIPVVTEYHFYQGARASQMRVTRTIGFDENTPTYTGVGVRAWEPRVPLSVLPNVVYPNDENAVTTVPATACGGDCVTPVGATWNGKWYADIGPSGLALIVVRDPSMTTPVSLTVNYDSLSSANIASFVVMQPQDGWKAPITEVQYACFADLKSWPQAVRDLAQLPAGCGP
jgi:hypothetical protein